MELVSVITANYNGSRYLARAIESVLGQSYPEIEYIIVDDSSTDASREIIADYAALDSRIKPVFRDYNGGVARARNTGIEHSRGTYLTFLDADDMWAPEKVERQVALFRKHPRAGLVVTDAAVIDEQDRVIDRRKNRRKTKEGQVSLYDYLSGKCHLSINAMTRRECLEHCGYFNPDYVIGEDYELWMRITRHYEYYYLREELHRYRLHGDNATRDKLFNRASKVKILEELIDQNPSLMSELGRGFSIIMQRKYNSLGKAYYLADRDGEAEECFSKALMIRGSVTQRLKAQAWRMLLRSRQLRAS